MSVVCGPRSRVSTHGVSQQEAVRYGATRNGIVVAGWTRVEVHNIEMTKKPL